MDKQGDELDWQMKNIVMYPDPILSQRCAAVAIGDGTALSVLDKMLEYMYRANGGGLAAPQIGVLKRLVVIDTRKEPRTVYKLINPKIVWASDTLIESKEGCLSLPLLQAKIIRHEFVSVEYLNESFQPSYIENADGYLSVCLQHELDHLDGKLYIDRLSRIKRANAIRRFKRSLEKYNELQDKPIEEV
jgi:peptide deformylase